MISSLIFAGLLRSCPARIKTRLSCCKKSAQQQRRDQDVAAEVKKICEGYLAAAKPKLRPAFHTAKNMRGDKDEIKMPHSSFKKSARGTLQRPSRNQDQPSILQKIFASTKTRSRCHTQVLKNLRGVPRSGQAELQTWLSCCKKSSRRQRRDQDATLKF